jgi:DNA-binding SARP family transcriptional activator
VVDGLRQKVQLLRAPCVLNTGWSERLAPERRFHLLAYLAFQNSWVSRDQLAGLLWPERSNAAARSNLRYVLLQVKQLAWLAGFEMQGASVRWDVDTDLIDFERAIALRTWQAAVELYGGPLLEGMEQTASAPYADWLAFERERLAGLWRDALHARLAELA